ncbi:heavy-metal-associated domain-containing protein [Aquibacillus sp. 3ASR75-11]|uniref:Heavy-metal-associated domain-containing protein n=1 Tax=Terrihalobacillus insolitus TaxID=2950438 RepID=A0A9X3WZC4_9BACI|nr:heavy metal-associated domain-containing protein [Terrihalobacillus insolitus]MDC3426064.1 heavy-metal-associated domain-containing protein [Terrihalobacillus insolitus]
MSQVGKITLKVKGMHCDGCENRVQKVLSEVVGITKVNADHQTGEVEVRVTPAVSKDEITEKITHLGYEVI